MGQPKPAFRLDHDCFVVELMPPDTVGEEPAQEGELTLPFRKKQDLTPRETILAEVRVSGRIATKVCVQRLGIPSARAKRLLKELAEEGILTMEGSGRAAHYRLTDPN